MSIATPSAFSSVGALNKNSQCFGMNVTSYRYFLIEVVQFKFVVSDKVIQLLHEFFSSKFHSVCQIGDNLRQQNELSRDCCTGLTVHKPIHNRLQGHSMWKKSKEILTE